MEMWFWLLLVLAAIAGLVVALWRAVRHDGLGHRPPPASHHAWFERSEPLT